MDEIATLLDRARARAGVGYPGVFYFACRPRCYLARYAEILTNLSPLPPPPSLPFVRLLARLRRYEIAVRNKKQLKFVR